MLVATLAISGVPFFSGFFSKDAILWETWSREGGAFRYLWYIGFFTALMTSFYMFRLIYLTFYGKPRMSHEVEHHIHESPKTMTVPLIILAVGAIFAGYLGVPASLGGSNRFEKFLEPVFAVEAHGATTTAEALGANPEGKLVEGANPARTTEGEQAANQAAAVNQAATEGEVAGAPHKASHEFEPLEYILMGASIAAALLGWYFGRRFYKAADKDYKEPINEVAPAAYRTLFNKYWVDELYDYLFTGRRKLGPVRLGAQGLGDALWAFDANVIDGGVNGAGWLTKFTGTLSNAWDKWIIDGLLVNGSAIATRSLGYVTRLTQWGLVQWYALVMIFGLLGFVWYYMVR
jgi:NADH-quinone oxidoreductase subunit L